MDRRFVVAVVLGGVSVACATGVLEPGNRRVGPATVLVEPLGEEGERAGISGVLRHSRTERVLDGALIVLQCTCLAREHEAVTDAAGMYSFRNLPPGRYTVQVLHGQANVQKVADLPAGLRMRMNFLVDPEHRFIVT
jgi:hypothetical protein